ncbi:ketopantoate reductase panE/ApbA domain-containing protein [Sarocladium implicatum]|nr:ketopantoate reductase panE/ApbA domain-containing protein [Sarocladium implicatum]
MGSAVKSNILVIGFGGIGTITAYNLEASGLASVTGVLRSNHDQVNEHGFNIWSCDHGEIASWKPTQISRTVPNVKDDASAAPFDYIVVCTKNIIDVPPTVAEIISPAVTPNYTAIVLVQNGLNIEKPLIAAFPGNIVISGISRMSSAELSPGKVFHQDHDILIIGAFRNPNLKIEDEQASAKHFCDLYNASGKATGQYEEDVAFMRWRKLVYNASWNSLCAITRMDTSKLRIAKFPITELVLPVMLEIKSISRAAGVKLAADQEDVSLAGDALDAYFRPSMQQDIEKGNFMELEIIVGESVREAQRLGVPAPTLTIIYSLLKTLQAGTKMSKGMIQMPPANDYGAGEKLAKFKATLVLFSSSGDVFQKADEIDAYTYYVDTLAGQFQAYDSLHNPYRKLSVLALSSPVLLHTILSCAAEHMHICGRLPIQQAIQQQERAIRLIRAGLSGWEPCGISPLDAGSGLKPRLLSADQALLAAILLQPAVLAFSGSNLAHAQTHRDMASFILSKVGYLDSPDTITSSFIKKLLVQRFAIIDISLSIFDRQRPCIPEDHWLGQKRNSSVIDDSQPTLREMTGCDHITYTFILQAAHLAADRTDHELDEKLFEDAIALETDIRQHLRNTQEAISADDRSKSSKPIPLSIRSLSRAFSGAALLLLLRRVFREDHLSPRVKNAVSTVCSAVEAISQCTDNENEFSSHSAVDSAMALPFYLAARDAAEPKLQEWMLEKHRAWGKVYPNPARARMMELAERIWEERGKGLGDIEARCEEVEKSYKVWIL